MDEETTLSLVGGSGGTDSKNMANTDREKENVPETLDLDGDKVKVPGTGLDERGDVPGTDREYYCDRARVVLPAVLEASGGTGFFGFINGGRGFLLQGEPTPGEPTKLEDVWVDNFDAAFEAIQKAVHEGGTFFVGLDTEFCRIAGVTDPKGAPVSKEAHYDQVRRIVNGGSLLQIGLVIANETFQIVPPKIFQFNLWFDHRNGNSDIKTLRFLTEIAKMNLDEHVTRGVPSRKFFRKMSSVGLVGNKNLVWITYQGYLDYGYLVTGLEDGNVLPPSRTEFIQRVQCYFPRSYDLKRLHELGICCKAPPPMPRPKGTGGFQAMSNGLGVVRIGEAHGAGSDAHLAVACFKTMMLSTPTAAALLSRFRNSMYGVTDALTLPWEDSETTEIAVCASNFDSQVRLFSKLFSDCHQLFVSVEVSYGNGVDFNGKPISYATLLTDAALSGPFDISFAVSDHTGCLAFGRLWSFRVGRGYDRIDPARLAKVLTEDEVVLNPRILWCSSSSASFAYLVKFLSSSNCLPPKLQAFLALMASYFPNHRVVMLPQNRNRLARRALLTLRQFQELLTQPTSWAALSDLTD